MNETDKELMTNASGYSDPTAYAAIKHIESESQSQDINDVRFYKLLHTIFHICEIAGFRLEGRITLVDKKTGKRWE